MYQPRQSRNAPICKPHSFQEKLQAVLRAGSSDPDFGLREAARQLHFSERSLQRKLQHLGTSFRQELLATRCQIAKTLLADGHKTAEVARAVGYRHREHFARAFARCQGESPSSYRQSIANELAAPLETLQKDLPPGAAEKRKHGQSEFLRKTYYRD